MFCKNCGNKLDDDALFCMNCGVKLSDATTSKYCGYCGNKLESDAVFCISCGKKIHVEEPQANTNAVKPIESENVKEESAKIASQKTGYTEKNIEPEIPFNKIETVASPAVAKTLHEEKLEFKDFYGNGKHFVYIDDSSKLFCPKCHKRADIYATMCSNCNESFVVQNESSSNTDSSWHVQKIDFDNAEKKSADSTTVSNNKGINGLLVAVVLFTIVISAGMIFSRKSNDSLQVSNVSATSDTFNFDYLKPYTHRSEDGKYEFDDYEVSKGTLSKLWNSPPKYFVYKGKKYEVDNKNIDYADDDYEDYNMTIIWGDHDGTYYHFLAVKITNGKKIMLLSKR